MRAKRWKKLLERSIREFKAELHEESGGELFPERTGARLDNLFNALSS